MSSTTPARPMSCRCAGAADGVRPPRAPAAPPRAPASAATPGGVAAREARLDVGVFAHGADRRLQRVARQAHRLRPARPPARRLDRRHVERGEQLRRVTAEDLDQLRIVAVAGARAHERDGLVGAEQAPRRLGVGGELDQPHRAIDRLALELRGSPFPSQRSNTCVMRVRDPPPTGRAAAASSRPTSQCPRVFAGMPGSLPNARSTLLSRRGEGLRCGRCWRPSRAASPR